MTRQTSALAPPRISSPQTASLARFGAGVSEGAAGDSARLGGKGAHLCELARLGLPTQPGFVIALEAGRKAGGAISPELWVEIDQALAWLEQATGLSFADPSRPLLVSVRSSPPVSMPGMMDTLLNVDAGPKPDMVATDTASYSDIVFGLFRMLGYRFSPRIADLSDQRFWRAHLPGAPAGDYGLVNGLARNKVNLDKIRAHWPDMLRVAGSLVTHRVRAYDLLRMLGRDGHPSALGQAFAEYGRIAKTLHLLALIDPVDEGYRRSVHRQLTVQESRHRLARKIFHGQRGELRQSYREGQEDQLGALGLVVNAVVLWNTRYIDAAVASVRTAGHELSDADVARLSPLGHAHINMLGRYSFAAPAGAGLRPLRDPAADDEET